MEREELVELGYALRGTCETLGAFIERKELDIAPDELEDLLLDVSTECCSGCGWWMESSDLVDEDDEPCQCAQCRGLE